MLYESESKHFSWTWIIVSLDPDPTVIIYWIWIVSLDPDPTIIIYWIWIISFDPDPTIIIYWIWTISFDPDPTIIIYWIWIISLDPDPAIIIYCAEKCCQNVFQGINIDALGLFSVRFISRFVAKHDVAKF